MNLFRLKSYLNFLVNSTNQHGIHPPFLYGFVTKCLYAEIDNETLNVLKKSRQKILESDEVISMIDHGAGSQNFSSQKRSVSNVAMRAGMRLHQSKLMNKIIRYFDVKTALEFGTSVGLGSVAMASKNPSLSLDTVDACPNTSAVAKKNFQKLNLDNISVYNKDFNTFIDHLDQQKTYDLIYIDGDHKKDATLAYFDRLKKHSHQQSILIFDDIYWSSDMKEAWQCITEDKDVKLSLDLYFWGIVFFKPELTKQHFRIRCFK